MRQINDPGLDDSRQDTTQPVTLPEMLPVVPSDPPVLPEFEDEALANGPTVRDSRQVRTGKPAPRSYARPNVVTPPKEVDDEATPVDPRVPGVPHVGTQPEAPSGIDGDEVETKDSSDFTPFDPRFSTGKEPTQHKIKNAGKTALPVDSVTEEKTPVMPLPAQPFPAQPRPRSTPEDDATRPYFPSDQETRAYLEAAQNTLDATRAYVPAALENTLPKNWADTGRLSVQAIFNPINVMPGERIRVPISVRNAYDHRVELQPTIAGLPADWIVESSGPLSLGPGQVQPYYFTLQTRPNVTLSNLRAMIRLTDAMNSQIALSTPLDFVLKRAPDLVGWLSPATIRDSRPCYLYLQNHALAPAKIFVSAQTQLPDIHINAIPYQIELPPGQIAKITLALDVRQRPIFRGQRCQFWVTAQEGSRAPLDFAGVVYIPSRIGF